MHSKLFRKVSHYKAITWSSTGIESLNKPRKESQFNTVSAHFSKLSPTAIGLFDCHSQLKKMSNVVLILTGFESMQSKLLNSNQY